MCHEVQPHAGVGWGEAAAGSAQQSLSLSEHLRWVSFAQSLEMVGKGSRGHPRDQPVPCSAPITGGQSPWVWGSGRLGSWCLSFFVGDLLAGARCSQGCSLGREAGLSPAPTPHWLWVLRGS